MQKDRERKFVFFLAACGLFLSGICGVFAAQVSYDPGGRRDPFIPLQGGEIGSGRSKAVGMVLEGIIYDPPENSMALISGQPYKVGDTLGTGKVLEIRKSHVVVDVNNEAKILWLREDERI